MFWVDEDGQRKCYYLAAYLAVLLALVACVVMATAVYVAKAVFLPCVVLVVVRVRRRLAVYPEEPLVRRLL